MKKSSKGDSLRATREPNKLGIGFPSVGRCGVSFSFISDSLNIAVESSHYEDHVIHNNHTEVRTGCDHLGYVTPSFGWICHIQILHTLQPVAIEPTHGQYLVIIDDSTQINDQMI